MANVQHILVISIFESTNASDDMKKNNIIPQHTTPHDVYLCTWGLYAIILENRFDFFFENQFSW